MLSQEYRVTDSCTVLGLARSSYYHRAEAKDERALGKAIREVAGKFPTYGSRRIKAQLEREPYRMVVGRHLVRRLMREMDLLGKPKRRKCGTTDSQHGYRRYHNLLKGKKVTRPNQVWVVDITYLRLRAEDVYLSILMDVYTRSVRAWNLSWSLEQELALLPLKQALRRYPAPDIHHSDQGTQYAAHSYVKLLQDAGTQISMARVGKPSENGYAERMIRTIKEEEVYLNEYRNMAEAKQEIGHFIDVVYQHKRVHSALDYMTPAEYEKKWYQNPPSHSRFLCPVY